MMKKFSTIIHDAFEVGILLKGLNAALEIVGGLLLMLVKPDTISRLAAILTEGEFSEDPRDKVANWLLRSARDLAVSGRVFGTLFLLSHGVIKLLLITALFKKKLWAYPAAVLVFALFIAYQMYRYWLDYSVWMLILSALDIIVIILTVLEYRRLKRAIL